MAEIDIAPNFGAELKVSQSTHPTQKYCAVFH